MLEFFVENRGTKTTAKIAGTGRNSVQLSSTIPSQKISYNGSRNG